MLSKRKDSQTPASTQAELDMSETKVALNKKTMAKIQKQKLE